MNPFLAVSMQLAPQRRRERKEKKPLPTRITERSLHFCRSTSFARVQFNKMRRYGLVTCALLAALHAGCEKRTSATRDSSTTTATAVEASPLAPRLEAAMQIASNDARDAALRKIALDAAKANDAAITKAVVGRILGDSLRERTAEEAALIFAQAGMHRTAKELAQLIASNDARDRTLSAIAKGEPSPEAPAKPQP